jgi:hypothetical protein
MIGTFHGIEVPRRPAKPLKEDTGRDSSLPAGGREKKEKGGETQDHGAFDWSHPEDELR